MKIKEEARKDAGIIGSIINGAKAVKNIFSNPENINKCEPNKCFAGNFEYFMTRYQSQYKDIDWKLLEDVFNEIFEF